MSDGRRILVNKARCRKCDTVVESRHRWDCRSCKCGAVAVDGGHAYLRRLGEPEDVIELSEFGAVGSLGEPQREGTEK